MSQFNPTLFFNWNGSVGNITQTTAVKFRETSELNNSIDIRFSNNYNVPYVVSQIPRHELSVISGRNHYLICIMNVATDTVQPTVTKLVRHGIPTIDTLNENVGTWISTTSVIKRTPNTTHGSTSENVVGKGSAVGSAVIDYREKTMKRILKLRAKFPNFKASAKILN